MDSPVLVRPAGNGPEGETGTTVRYQKTGGFLKPEGALIPPPKDAVQHRMGVEVHTWTIIAKSISATYPDWSARTLSMTFTIDMMGYAQGALLLLLAAIVLSFLISFAIRRPGEGKSAQY